MRIEMDWLIIGYISKQLRVFLRDIPPANNSLRLSL